MDYRNFVWQQREFFWKLSALIGLFGAILVIIVGSYGSMASFINNCFVSGLQEIIRSTVFDIWSIALIIALMVIWGTVVSTGKYAYVWAIIWTMPLVFCISPIYNTSWIVLTWAPLYFPFLALQLWVTYKSHDYYKSQKALCLQVPGKSYSNQCQKNKVYLL